MTQFANPLSPVRDTSGYYRADRGLVGGGSSGSYRTGPLAPSIGGAAADSAPTPQMPMNPLNPYRAINRENAANSDAGAYAGPAFNNWYAALKPEESAKFAGPDPNHENAAGIQRTNAMQHFTANVLPNDPHYQALQAQQRDARNARMDGVTVGDEQRDTASATGARNQANAIATDAAARSTMAQGEASEAGGRGDLARAQGTTLIPAQARGLDADAAAKGTAARIQSEQWDATKPLYPGQIQAGIDVNKSKAGLNQAQADATRAQGTASAVSAYGNANRGTEADPDPITSYGAPTPGSLLPTITRTPRPLPANPTPTGATSAVPVTQLPLMPGAPSGIASLQQRFNVAGTPAAPANPAFLDKVFAGGKATQSPSTLLSPWSLLGPVGAAVKYAKNFAAGYQNPQGLPQQGQPQPAPLPRPSQPGARLDPNTAAAFLKVARGDKNAARQMAQQLGWSF